MLPLYLAGAAALGAGAFLLTRKSKIPPAVAQAAIQSPPPAPAPAPAARTSPSAVITPNSPEVQAAVAAANGVSPEQAAFDAAKAQAAAASQQAFQQQFPGTGINPGIQSATQFNPAPGPGAGSPEVAAAAQAASDALQSGGVFASPAQQAQSAVDLLNQLTQ